MVRSSREIRWEIDDIERRLCELRHELFIASHPILKWIYDRLIQVDPNWSSVSFMSEKGKLDAWLNGPEYGDVSINEMVSKYVPTRSIARYCRRTADMSDETVSNPVHRVQLIPNGLLLWFDNDLHELVSSVRDAKFVSRVLDCSISVQNIQRDLADEGDPAGVSVISIHYLPYFDRDLGRRIEVPGDVLR